LGTTLQVRAQMWPPDRAAFDEYWKRTLDDLRVDEPVREHLYGVASVAFLPSPLRQLVGPPMLFATKGFLASTFRTLMRWDWTPEDQRRFALVLAGLRVADRIVPREAWTFGYRLYLWDMRVRARLGKRVV
jgi:uncharacterized protein (DUF2236 family)